jgi:hypothetical protein
MSALRDRAAVGDSPRLGAGFARWAVGLLPARHLLLCRSTTPDEAVLATFGAVQVRRTRAGVVARTAVRGDCASALQIASVRLANYIGGDNRRGLPVPAARPVVQRPGGSGRWLVQIGLPGEYTQFSAPVPHSCKVRIQSQPGATFAIIRLPGQPRTAALARGEAAVVGAIASGGWVAAGTPVLRLQAPPGLLPWTGEFEVAVPVIAA